MRRIVERSRKRPTVGLGPVLALIFLIQIRHNHPTLWARKRFVRAGGYPRGTVAPGILELTAYDQPKDMGRVVQDGNTPFTAHGGEVPYWLRKQKQTLAQH